MHSFQVLGVATSSSGDYVQNLAVALRVEAAGRRVSLVRQLVGLVVLLVLVHPVSRVVVLQLQRGQLVQSHLVLHGR